MNPAHRWKSLNGGLASALRFSVSGRCAVRGRFLVNRRACGKRDKCGNCEKWNNYLFHVLMS